jgi:hypothetical protein
VLVQQVIIQGAAMGGNDTVIKHNAAMLPHPGDQTLLQTALVAKVNRR